jgi:hypothetical protein
MKLASSSRPGQRLWSLHLQLTFSLLKMSLKLHFDRSLLNSLLPASTQLSEKKLFKALKGSLNSQELCV